MRSYARKHGFTAFFLGLAFFFGSFLFGHAKRKNTGFHGSSSPFFALMQRKEQRKIKAVSKAPEHEFACEWRKKLGAQTLRERLTRLPHTVFSLMTSRELVFRAVFFSRPIPNTRSQRYLKLHFYFDAIAYKNCKILKQGFSLMTRRKIRFSEKINRKVGKGLEAIASRLDLVRP